MTRERFRVLVSEAIDTIPPRFAGAMTNIAIVVEAAATAEVLDELEMDPGDELFGLYQGTPLPERGWAFGNALPDRITLYQQTIEDFCEGDEDCIVMMESEGLVSTATGGKAREVLVPKDYFDEVDAQLR